MVNISKICKTFKSKMDKAVKSITILKRPGSSNSSIGSKREELLAGSPNIVNEDDAKLGGNVITMSDLKQNAAKEENKFTSNEIIFDPSQKGSKEEIESRGNQEDYLLNESSHGAMNLIENKTEEEIELTQSNEAVLDLSRKGIKEIESTENNGAVLDLSRNGIKEIESTQSNKDVLDLSRNGIEEIESTQSNEDVLDLSRNGFKGIESTQSNEDVLDLSRNGIKEGAKFSGSNEEVLDVKQLISNENMDLTGGGCENVLNVTESNEDSRTSNDNYNHSSNQPVEAQSLNSSPRIETQFENESGMTNGVNENEPDNLTRDCATLVPEVKKITILKRPPGLTKTVSASSSPLRKTNVSRNGSEESNVGENTASTSTESNSPRSPSGEKQQHQEVKFLREIILLKEETFTKPFTILKRPENVANGSLLKGQADTPCTTPLHVEPIETKPIEIEITEPCEPTEKTENEEKKEEEPVQNFTILKRPEIANDKLESKSAQQIKTLEERKREYYKARIRIFGTPGSYEEVINEDEGGNQVKSPTIESHQESTSSSPSKSPPIFTSKSPKKKKTSPPHEQSNSCDVPPIPHINELATPEQTIETPNELLEITSNTLLAPCSEIPTNSSGPYKEMSRNSLDFYNEIPADFGDLHNKIPSAPTPPPLRSNGSQHPLHYYNQPLPSFQPFYNGMMDAMPAYYHTAVDYNVQYGPFWSEGATNYAQVPVETEIPSYGPPFNNFGTHFSMPPEDLFYTYVNGYHIPGVNDFTYDVHVDDYSSYDLSFSDFEGTGVST